MFLKIIENFHLELSKHIEESTISIGGEEKKAKITQNLNTTTLPGQSQEGLLQATQDATKFNECVSAQAFALMHYTFFDNATRIRLGLPKITKNDALFQKIAIAGNFILAVKRITLGPTTMMFSKLHYNRPDWDSKNLVLRMNSNNKGWVSKILPLLEDKIYVRAAPGMLMGMMNAGSTTLALAAAGYRQDTRFVKVSTLRSSDDSMTAYAATSSK